MLLYGSVKLRCALGSGSSDGGAAGLPRFSRPSASRCFSLSASIGALPPLPASRRPPAPPSPPGSRQPSRLVSGPPASRHHARLSVLVLLLILLLGCRPHARHFGSHSSRVSSCVDTHLLCLHTFTLIYVPSILRGLIFLPGCLTQLQTYSAPSAFKYLFLNLLSFLNPRIERDYHHYIFPLSTFSLNPPRRIDPLAYPCAATLPSYTIYALPSPLTYRPLSP